MQVKPAHTSRDSSRKDFRFVLHSSHVRWLFLRGNSLSSCKYYFLSFMGCPCKFCWSRVCSSGLPRGGVSILSSWIPSPDSQKLCLWESGEASALLPFSAQEQACACRLCVRKLRCSQNAWEATALGSAPSLRANESALKMPADRRDSKAYFSMKFGEWAFSLERLYSSYRLHLQALFPKRIPKVPFGEPLLPFASQRKVVPAPARGADPAPAEFLCETTHRKIFFSYQK